MKFGVDLDGVIALNDEDRKRYRPNMKPYYEKCYLSDVWKELEEKFGVPDYVVTSRKERYRDLTEGWLKQNNIKYGGLVMMQNGVSKTKKSVVSFKTEMVRVLEIQMYLDDDPDVVSSVSRNTRCDAKLVEAREETTIEVGVLDVDDINLQTRFNPNVMTKPIAVHLKKSMRDYGFVEPITVAETPEGKYAVLDGEHRLNALREMGEGKVLCNIVKGLSGEEIRAGPTRFNAPKGSLSGERVAKLLLDAEERFGEDKTRKASGLPRRYYDEYTEMLAEPDTEELKGDEGEEREDIEKYGGGRVSREVMTFNVPQEHRPLVNKLGGSPVSRGEKLLELCKSWERKHG